MATSPDALTTLEDLKRYLQLSSDQHDQLLESLIEAVSAQFNRYTGRKLAARDYHWDPAQPAYAPDQAILDGTGHPELLLPQYPLLRLDELRLDSRSLALEELVLDRAAGVIALRQGVFPRGRANLALAYRAGFDPIPPDLAQAALEQTAVRFQESGAGLGRLGVSARTLADGSVSYQEKPLLPQVREVLDRYRRRAPL